MVIYTIARSQYAMMQPLRFTGIASGIRKVLSCTVIGELGRQPSSLPSPRSRSFHGQFQHRELQYLSRVCDTAEKTHTLQWRNG